MRRVFIWPAAAIGAAALVTFPYWTAEWESSRFATTVLRDILVFAIFALSLDLLVGRAGMPSLGHAAFFGAGAYAAGVATQRLGTDQLPLTLGAAALVAAAMTASSSSRVRNCRSGLASVARRRRGRAAENDGLRWPRRDGLEWLHLASVVCWC